MHAQSNGVPVPTDPGRFAPLRDSTALLDDPAALCERFSLDGYLYLRGVLDRRDVLGLRAAYFSLFGHGYLQPGTAAVDGIWSGESLPGLPAHGVAGHPAHRMVRSRLFARFAANPRLERLAEIVLGEPEVMRLPRQILRHYHKGPVSSRAHTDFDYLDRGSDHVVTMWIPVGDCPVPTGGLIYLENSHTLGSDRVDALKTLRTDRPGDPRPISHDLGWTQRQLGGRWLFTNYEAGDVTIHSPHIVHASLDTTTEMMRMSADIRFTPITVEPDPRWLTPWSGDDGN
jgi:hypothetical protein